jgi:hypothetical protein
VYAATISLAIIAPSRTQAKTWLCGIPAGATVTNKAGRITTDQDGYSDVYRGMRLTFGEKDSKVKIAWILSNGADDIDTTATGLNGLIVYNNHSIVSFVEVQTGLIYRASIKLVVSRQSR